MTQLLTTAAILIALAAPAVAGTVTVTKIDGRTETITNVRDYFVRVQSNGAQLNVVINQWGEEQIYRGVSVKYVPDTTESAEAAE